MQIPEMSTSSGPEPAWVERTCATSKPLEGKVYLSDAMAEKMLHPAVGENKQRSARPAVELLADRELEVFRLIGQGLKTATIAGRLHFLLKDFPYGRSAPKTAMNSAALDYGIKSAFTLCSSPPMDDVLLATFISENI